MVQQSTWNWSKLPLKSPGALHMHQDSPVTCNIVNLQTPVSRDLFLPFAADGSYQ